MSKEREFKIDMALAGEIAVFLEALVLTEAKGEFNADEPCTDTFLDQFMPNGDVPPADINEALLASGIVTRMSDMQ